jgi:YbbR domain-containing protein
MAPNIEKWIDSLLHRKGIKLLAFILAAGTWFYIRELTSFEEVVSDVPVEVLLPDGWAVQERSVNSVEVAFRGSQADIRALNKSQIRVQVDARDKKGEPSVILKIDRSNVTAPRSVRVMYVDPSEFVLTLDRESDKEVPVRVEQLGQVPDGFDIEKIVITPPAVKVHGPERRLASVEYVRTVPIDMEGRIRSFQLNRALMTPGENWQARMDVDKVRVEFTIVERAVLDNFTNVPVRALLPLGFSSDIRFFPDEVNVSLKGRTDVISNLTAKAIYAYVDCATLKLGEDANLPVQVPTPPGVTVLSIEPQVVRVSMRDTRK